jgi:hypothetical protein
MANSSVSGTWLYDPTKHIWQTQVQVLFCSFFSVVYIFILNRSERGQVCVVHNGELVFGQPIDISSPFR